MISNKDLMHILIAWRRRWPHFFSEAMAELKMNNKLTLFNDGQELMDYLSDPDIVVPHIFCFRFKHALYVGFWMFKNKLEQMVDLKMSLS
jgi:hypothetical protein